MAPLLGFTFLLVILVFTLFLPGYAFFSAKKAQRTTYNGNLENLCLVGSALVLLCAICAQLALIYSFIISDYSVKNVYQNSHHLKPLIYKISASWGNHEGSMLLLITILSGYNFAFNFLSKINYERKIIITCCQSLIIGLFAAFTIFSSNPFARIFPEPFTGLGLNPILQDIGLALHPPMLYTGYLGFSMIFSFAITALLTEKIDDDFVKLLKPWLLFTWGFLTLGVGLGAWWAYRELGWGGYWFWDPVENVSLMPWLCATALIHSAKIAKRGSFKIFTVFLAILTFILCLVGIFLVRSGILTSVHAFAIDAKRGFFVIGLIAIIGGSALLILARKAHKISSKNEKFALLSRPGFYLINNYLLLIALFVVLLGTIYPILMRSFFDEFVSIGPNYYNQIFGLMIIPFLGFLVLSNVHSIPAQAGTQPHSSLSKDFFRGKMGWVHACAGMTGVVMMSLTLTSLSFFYEKNVNLLQLIILFLAILTLFTTLKTKQNTTSKIAHFGFVLVIVGIVLSSYFSITKELNLQVGQSFSINNSELNFAKTEYAAGSNYVARQGDFVVDNGNELKPQLRFYPISNQTTNESAIDHGFFGDLYLVIGNKDEQENYAIRAYYKPFIYLIWAGCVMMFLAMVFWFWKNFC